MRRHIESALKHIRRTPYQSSAALIIAAITFFVATFFILLALFSSSLLNYFESQPQITVFFEDTKTEEQIKQLQSVLEQNEKIEAVKYISKSEALRIYQEDHKDDPLLLEMVTADILPAALEIRATDVSFLDDIASLMQKEEGIEDVVYQKDVVDRLVSWTRSLRAMGLILLSVLSIETVLVILVIIGMGIVGRRKEIVVMQLIGASSWYIRMPYIIEGMLYGISGAFLGWLLTYAIIIYQKPFLSELLSGINKLSLPYFYNLNIWPITPFVMFLLFAVIVAFGLILGAFSSYIAARRYLR